jgi:ornithine decarboxylase
MTDLLGPTPYLLLDLDRVEAAYAGFTAALPGVDVHYAMKCNPDERVLRRLHRLGGRFEIASAAELRQLAAIGVDPAGVLYSNPVKPAGHIAAAYRAGVWRFSFDGPNELAKIAEHAPGAAVYVRLRVDDSTSTFPLSRKFGTDVEDGYDLMLLAERLGLRPYGITFHVGSQCTSPKAWHDAIGSAGELMNRLADDDIRVEMLDLGGGFPARYTEEVPSIEEIGSVIRSGLASLLPYRPALIVAEPGRHLLAEAGVLSATVLGRETRGDEHWLYLEVGTYNGLMEVLQTPGGWDFPMWTDRSGDPHLSYTVTGPTCDSTDTIGAGVLLPATLAAGDVVHIGSAGAYTLAYASDFNGFPAPVQVFR